MRYIDLCDKYFLILMIVSSVLVFYFDGNNFKKQDKIKEFKQCRIIGGSALGISICLFILNVIF